jgi:hypothetical protein
LANGESAESIPEGEVTAFTHAHGLQVLRLLSEYYAVGDETLAGTDYRVPAKQGSDALLETLREDAEPTSSTENPLTRKDAVRRELMGLLGLPGADQVFFEVLEAEGNRFRAALPILKQKAKLDELIHLARNKQTALYQKDRADYGTLQATTEANIGALEGGVTQAKEDFATKTRSLPEQSRGWLLTQELLGYKNQMDTNGGFALTPSRQKMIDRMLQAMLHGEKVLALGSTGTGKTELAIAVAKIASGGKEPIVVEVHENMTVADLMGRLGIKAVGTAQMETELVEGPILQAKREHRVLILDEKTTGPNRLFMGIKATLNKLERDRSFPGLIATGNIKDERTRDREETDPAVLRMYRAAIQVPYMSEEEHYKVVLAQLMDPTGLLPFPKTELLFLRKLTKAGRLMQMCHDRSVGALTTDLPEANRKMLADCFGGELDQIHLDKNFLDTGTLLSLFKGWSNERAKGKPFKAYLKDELVNFLDSAKFSMDEDERKLARTIMELTGVLSGGEPDGPKVVSNENPYLLPSEVGELFSLAPSDDDPRGKGKSGGEDDTPKPPEDDPIPPELTRENFEWVENKLRVDYYFSKEAIEKHFLREGDRPVPAKADIIDAVREKLTNAQVNHLRALEVAGREIRFFLTPMVSGARFKEVLSKPELMPFFQHQGGQVDPFMHSNYEVAINACRTPNSRQTESITEYAWTLGDSSDDSTAKAGDPDDSYNQADHMTLGFRSDAFNTHHQVWKTGLSSMDSAEYAMLQVLKAMEGKYCDDINRELTSSDGTLGTYTVLPAKNDGITGKATMHRNGNTVCLGFLDSGSGRQRLDLSEEPLSTRGRKARLRSRVMHKI